MGKFKKLFSIIFAFIFVFICSSCSKSTDINISNSEKKRDIALILKMNSGYHWGTIKLGADAAAREFNVDIDYAAPDSEEDIDGQIKLVNQKLDDPNKKPDALILAASDFEALTGVTQKAYDNMHIPVIIVDSNVDTDRISSYIATDNIDAGQKAGKMLIGISGTKCNIAIMSFVKGSKNAEERERGLKESISKYPNIKIVDTEYCLSDDRLANTLTKKIVSENPRVDAIVALNETSAEGVADAIDELGLKGKVKIIAFDSTQKEIDYLEKGVIQSIIAQNPFSIGYLAVKAAVDALDGKRIAKRIYIDSKAITRDNMYLPENQKLLFPFIK